MLPETTAVFNSTTIPPTTHGFEDDANALVNRVLTTISASLSLLGTSFIIATFIAWKDFRSTSRRILVYISISDFLIAGGNLFGVWLPKDDSTALCESQSFVTTCASLWSFFWTTFLAIFMYIVVARKQPNKAETMLKCYHIIGWGIPLAVTGTALGLGKLGNDKDLYSAGWCWIDSKLTNRDKHLWMLITGKAWEISAFICIAIFYLMLRCHIRKELHHHQKQFTSPQSKESALKAEKRLTLVPVIFVLVRIWGTLRFVIYMSAGIQDTNTAWGKSLLYLQGIGDSSQGFFNFLLFCLFTEKFQTRLRSATHALLLNCKKQPSCSPSRENKSDETHSHQQTLINESTSLLGSV